MYTCIICVRSYTKRLVAIRHVLHPVLRHHHAEHQPPQSQRQGQDHARALHLHEPGDQQRRGPACPTAHGNPSGLPHQAAILGPSWL